jgi:hypothetical protein
VLFDFTRAGQDRVGSDVSPIGRVMLVDLHHF